MTHPAVTTSESSSSVRSLVRAESSARIAANAQKTSMPELRHRFQSSQHSQSVPTAARTERTIIIGVQPHSRLRLCHASTACTAATNSKYHLTNTDQCHARHTVEAMVVAIAATVTNTQQ